MPKLSTDKSAAQRDQAYRSLRRLLILQQVDAGERLREPMWAERLRVHRSALREAFARLEAEGLIRRGAKTGYFVPELTAADIVEISKLRLALECLAIEEVCAAPSPDLSAMIRAGEEFERLAASEYLLGVIEADRRFHEALIEAAKMQRLSHLYHRAPLPLIHGNAEDQTTWRDACARTLAEHRGILAALAARDAAEAKRVLRGHLAHMPLLPLAH
jgi:DNA-binding GntR family transcriptional regulator